MKRMLAVVCLLAAYTPAPAWNGTGHMVVARLAWRQLTEQQRGKVMTGFVASLARQTVRHNVTINNLLPGRFDTDRLRANLAFAAARAGIVPEEEARRACAEVPVGRFGHPDELGAACAYVCSAHAGFVTGQNLLLDGGAFPGLL
jgi:hypothetical protein